LVAALTHEMLRSELTAALELRDRMHFVQAYLEPALAAGLVEMTIPDKPNSRLQRYRLTERGRALVGAKGKA
jgi:ATP-dependent DNA helicase RecG